LEICPVSLRRPSTSKLQILATGLPKRPDLYQLFLLSLVTQAHQLPTASARHNSVLLGLRRVHAPDISISNNTEVIRHVKLMTREKTFALPYDVRLCPNIFPEQDSVFAQACPTVIRIFIEAIVLYTP
jgi:hypothetical protein